MAKGHDIRYKELFSHPVFVEELLRGFVREDFIDNLDFSTIEQANRSFVPFLGNYFNAYFYRSK